MCGDGETSRQILGAPREAVFIWCNQNLGYPKDLARALGRQDLTIIGPEDAPYRLRGRRNLDIIIDHACLPLREPALAAIHFASRKGA